MCMSACCGLFTATKLRVLTELLFKIVTFYLSYDNKRSTNTFRFLVWIRTSRKYTANTGSLPFALAHYSGHIV
ncbi:uncharacterized protein PHALS_14594 [Plasmopara halstedii]|uniref:RxLR-like protein n=1 Tax=Plasmopara halstedii TaxID=4781 RepID=A0A0P1AM68_PLAHL|nr:uncharacterized protein PHALS_14594 [Plasmopara halstedii]CEG42119.1 hypothetical protein PHALS_14594 [Plasmopara halstedii]|eukprot:XP_024578488.1 hypothetical protein PHALS_14594 [Plasmopara halstedii]